MKKVNAPAGFLAAAMLAYSKHPSEATLFFENVVTNEHVINGKKSTMVQYLATWLAGGHSGNSRFAREALVRSIASWNRWLSGDEAEHIKYTHDRPIPEVL